MKAANFIRKITAKLGLIKVLAENDQAGPVGVETVRVSLTDLQAKYKNNMTSETIYIPEIIVDFDVLLESLKINIPAHGWTATRIAKLLLSDEFKAKDKNTVKKQILDLLMKEQVPVEDIIKDAVSRDQALDSFEQIVHNKLLTLVSSGKSKITELEAEIVEKQGQIKDFRSSIRNYKDTYKNWLCRKTAKEEELLEVVSVIADKQEISLGPAVNADLE